MKSPIRLLLALALSATAGLAAADQVINYPAQNPIFSIAFPDDWKVYTEDQSVSATSADEMVSMELIALEAGSLDDAIATAKESLSSELEGLEFPEAPEKGNLNGVDVTFLNGKVNMEGMEMAVNCALFEPKSAKTYFMLFNLVPLDALKQHGDAISKVLNSIK